MFIPQINDLSFYTDIKAHPSIHKYLGNIHFLPIFALQKQKTDNQ